MDDVTHTSKIALHCGEQLLTMRERRVALEKALRDLVLMARTSGGVAGRDADLCKACDQAEAVLEKCGSFTD